MRSLLLPGCFLGLCSALGCSNTDESPYSSSTQAVTGRVRGVGGETVHGGAEITLTPKAKEKGIYGREGSSMIAADGSFSLKTSDGQEGIPAGFYVVVVRPYGAANNAAKQAATRIIPKKYWDESTSDLTVEITETKTNWEVKLAN